MMGVGMVNVLDELPDATLARLAEALAAVASGDHKHRMKALADKAAEAVRLKEEAVAAKAEAAKAVADAQAQMATERHEHDEALLIDRQALARDRELFEKRVIGVGGDAERLHAQARADADQVASKLKELNAKLAAIAKAAA